MLPFPLFTATNMCVAASTDTPYRCAKSAPNWFPAGDRLVNVELSGGAIQTWCAKSAFESSTGIECAKASAPPTSHRIPRESLQIRFLANGDRRRIGTQRFDGEVRGHSASMRFGDTALR